MTPEQIRWVAAGVPDKPAGVVVPLTPAVRAAVSDALDVAVGGGGVPIPIPVPVPTPAPAPAPAPAPTPSARLPARRPYARAVWATAGRGGVLPDADIVCPSDKAGQPDLYGVEVRAPKSAVTLRNVRLLRWSDGLCVEHTPEVLRGRLGDWVIEDCLFADSHGINPKELFRGQGAYLAAADRWVFRRCCFIGNGRARDHLVGVGNTTAVVSHGFSHGAYVQGGLTQWRLAQGCTRVRFEACVFLENAAWGACNRADGGEVVDCFFGGNAYAMLLTGPLPCAATGNAVVAGHACEWYGGQRGGSGGIQWRCAAGVLSDNLCVLPPAARMADRNWRAPAYELTAGKRANNTDPTYQGPVGASGGDNVALGWDADVTSWGATVPGLRSGPCPVADWAGLVARAVATAKAGVCPDAAALIAEARRMAAVA